MRRQRTKLLSGFYAVSFGQKALRNSFFTEGSPKPAPGTAVLGAGPCEKETANGRKKGVPILRNAEQAKKKRRGFPQRLIDSVYRFSGVTSMS